ncbi:flavodoxin family protein [Tsukamurella soli]|uniref:flavodoxin family protein n=1 Tax=Tsukamurella soli TaxID=644556 RepID=UPI00360970C1
MGETHEAAPLRALLLYYSYTGQSRTVLQAAGEVLRDNGFEVQEAAVELTDPRYAKPFARFPMRRVWPDMLSVLPAQVRRADARVAVPDVVREGGFDLVCIGSPTWWSTASLPIRSFLRSTDARKLLARRQFAVFVVCRDSWRGNLAAVRRLAEWQGGRYAGRST